MGASEKHAATYHDYAWWDTPEGDKQADAENENHQARLDQEADDHPIATY